MDRITVFKGVATAAGKDASLMYSIFTKHVGGDFDASVINEGCRFEMTYTGERGGLDLTLLSHSGGVHWARMQADEVKDNADGSYTAVFASDNIKKTYGTDIARLDEVRAVSNSDSEMSCLLIELTLGQGEKLNTGSPKWGRESTGIAFVGDSITQNVYFNEGDFNGLLDRCDCVNFGIGGQTSRHMVRRIDEVADRHFSKVVIWCGINDIGYGITSEETFGNIKTMIETCRAKNPGISFVIISVLPTGRAFYLNEQHRIVERNELAKAYADANPDVTFVDCYQDFIAPDGYCREGVTLDQLHPNNAGYALVKARLNPALDK